MYDVTGANATSVTGAIRQAAQKTGANFDYLVATARVESNLNPSARATASSAGGLFQFLEQTWLGTLKHAGPALGYGRQADAISVNSAGRFEVQDPRARQQILDLRNDPSANALMAGAFTRWNGEWLSNKLGRPPSEGELYLAHFLGAGGAAKLIGLAGSSPQASAAQVFPLAAGANKSIFYDRQGEPRSVRQVYNLMVGRYDVARAKSTVTPGTALAAAGPSIPVPAGQSARGVPAAPLFAMALPDATKLPSAVPVANTGDGVPVFHRLFLSDARRDAVAPVVSELWGSHAVSAPSPARAQSNADKPAVSNRMLELFRDNG